MMALLWEKINGSLILLIVCAVWIFSPAEAVLSGQPVVPKANLNPSGISPSAECGKCHKGIYETWSNSLHYQAVTNSVFWTSYLKSHYANPERAERVCLSCHAPVFMFNGDAKLGKPITREGINCDFCHSISEVKREKNRFRFIYQFGLLKQGPLKNVKSPAHKTNYNPLYKESIFCAGCHEYRGRTGVKLIETYSEWESSVYRKRGTHCQTCHMRKSQGRLVSPELFDRPKRELSSHDIGGGHSLTMREASLDIEVVDIERFRQKLAFAVKITNKGAGHKIPTGLPSKKVVLQVEVLSSKGESVQMERKVYQKLIVGRDGKPLDDDAIVMLGEEGTIQSDNRIGPLETRREEFSFFLPESGGKQIRATAFYVHNPEIMQAAPIHIKLKEVRALTAE